MDGRKKEVRMEATTQTKREARGFDLTNGRDELNLAEFPLFYLGQRVPKGLKTLEYETEVIDSGRNRAIKRRLQIVASDAYGLPTVRDADVLLSLILIAKQTDNLANNSVSFSRYQLRELLGWPDNGQSYKRIDLALRKWVTITLFFDSWWDKGDERWENVRGFHLLEDIELTGTVGRPKQSELPLSSVRFGRRFFDSLKSGNIRQLNLEDYFNLSVPAAKQAYRFLGKRFYHRHNLDFDLRTFACEHVGLSKNYPPNKLKIKLQPAIEELERIGYIKPATAEERFRKVGHGQYRVHFSLMKRQNLGDTPLLGNKRERSESRELIGELTGCGVTATVARKLVEDPAIKEQTIRDKIELLEWLQESKGNSSPRSPGGWITRAIKENWAAPKDFVSRAERQRVQGEANSKAKQKKLVRQAEEEKRDQAAAAEGQRHEQDWLRVTRYLNSLTELERCALIDKAIIGNDSMGYARKYRAKPEPNCAGEILYRGLLCKYVLPLLPVAAND